MTPRKRKASSISDESTDEILIIALDFGTTYSGVAYCFANKRDPKPAAILDWPGIGANVDSLIGLKLQLLTYIPKVPEACQFRKSLL